MQGDKSDNTRKRGLDEVMSDSGPEKRLRKENCVDKMAQGYTSDVQSMNDTPLSESSGSGSSEPPTTSNKDNNSCVILGAIHELRVYIDDRLEQVERSMTDKIKALVHEEVQVVRNEYGAKLTAIEQRVKTVEDKPEIMAAQPQPTQDLALNLVITKLPYTENENLINKINGLIKDGIKLKDVIIDEAKRKPAKNNTPGVVICKCKMEDKVKSLKAKSALKKSRNYKNVVVFTDRPLSERIQFNDMKLLVQTFASDTLELEGSRIFRRQQGHERRGGHYDQLDQHVRGRHEHQHERQHENQRPMVCQD